MAGMDGQVSMNTRPDFVKASVLSITFNSPHPFPFQCSHLSIKLVFSFPSNSISNLIVAPSFENASSDPIYNVSLFFGTSPNG